MELTIVTPTKSLVTKQPMVEVLVTGNRGELNIFPGHSPLLTTLTEGALSYKLESGDKKTVAISWGYCEVTPQGVNILAETAETPEEIDVSRAEQALKKSEEEMNRADITPEEIEKYRHKRMRAEARIKVGKKN